MTDAIADAIDQLNRHRGLTRVSAPRIQGAETLIEIDVSVELPSRNRAEGVSSTGVRAIETCFLVFPNDWPLSAPRAFLREDFPLNLPHINPHRPGQPVSPCLFEGSLDEVLHRFGIDAIVDQLVTWLHKAAAGSLIDLEQGWEPTRRDSCPSTVVFSAEKVAATAPEDGSLLVVNASYLTMDGGLYARLDHHLTARTDPIFDQITHNDQLGKWGGGHAAAFIARAAKVGGQRHISGNYQPETVVDLSTLLDRSAELGIDRAALEQNLDTYYSRSIVDPKQDPKTWAHGVYAIVILLVERPVPLVGSAGRRTEVLPYVVRYEYSAKSPFDRNATVHPAFHAHTLSPALLARTSGLAVTDTSKSLVMIGCGSLGSKIGLHLGRAGFGAMTFIDNESMAPHNAARHALVEAEMALAPPRKAELMKSAFEKLSHDQARALDVDAVRVFTDPSQFAAAVPTNATLIVDATASLKVLASEVCSDALNASAARLARVAMYGQGRCTVILLEGIKRSSRVDDLTAVLFEQCRSNAALRSAIVGDGADPTRVFVGDNCRSLTTPMSDATVSRAAANATLQIERWLADGLPAEARLCVGTAESAGIGMLWTNNGLGPTVTLDVVEDKGWKIRILAPVAQAIHADATHWSPKESGGALLGRISYEHRTISIAGLVDAPTDSIRKRGRFVLGTAGLVKQLREAHENSVGYLAFVGTWHSHPQGGPHSGIDRETLRKIAGDAGGLPAVSLVWTPKEFACAVDRW